MYKKNGYLNKKEGKNTCASLLALDLRRSTRLLK